MLFRRVVEMEMEIWWWEGVEKLCEDEEWEGAIEDMIS